MPSELQDLMNDVELLLVDTVGRLPQAEARRLYVEVLELEGRMDALHDALAYVADTIVDGVSLPLRHRPDRTI